MDEQEKQEKLVEAMAARLFERMMAMPHTDLCYRVGFFEGLAPTPLEVAEYARMAARSFYARLSSEPTYEQEEPTS